jgi:aminopeptidase N
MHLRSRLTGLGLACLCAPLSAAPPPSTAPTTLRADLAPIQSGLDYDSFANVEQFRVTHVDLQLRVDFVNKVLFGDATLEVKRLDPNAAELVLDTRDLDIRDVREKPGSVLGALSKGETTWVSRPFHLDKADPILGSSLVIDLPPLKKSTETIRIEYVTSPSAPTIQWLTDRQTAGKHHPFMYTLSAPIGARSWIPLQDSPMARVTYSALIHTERDLLAVMSTRNDPKVKHSGDYAFVMRDAVCPASIALAVGDLRFKETGPRTGVYAEKPLIAAAAKEFADTETLVRAGEKLFGPYRFERFDLVVMPPSFPLAEVGNPGAAFITPTAVTGDRSRESIVARALSQSWAGDLVSGATARDAWIDAALSVYMQDRLVREVYGEPRAALDRAAALGTLRVELGRMGSADQVLAADLRGRDPGTVRRDAADLKGGLLFAFLAEKFGGERLDGFLQAYFDHFALKSITTEQFLGYLEENLLDRYPGIVSPAQVTAWVMEPGLAPAAPLPTSNPFENVDAARAAWLAGKLPAKKLDTRDWLTPQWTYFLANMPPTLRKDQLYELDQTFALTRSENAEVAGGWLMLVVENTYQPSYPRLERYLETTGRRTLVTPLYVELMKTPAGAALAKRVYAIARPFYQEQFAQSLDSITFSHSIVNPGSEASDDE